MDKMIDKRPVVGRLVFDEAIRKKRLDALQLFLERAMFALSVEEMLQQAWESEDKEIMSVVEAGVAKLKWWQFWEYRNWVSRDYIPGTLWIF